jgi:hypothetical protein
MDKAT